MKIDSIELIDLLICLDMLTIYEWHGDKNHCNVSYLDGDKLSDWRWREK